MNDLTKFAAATLAIALAAHAGTAGKPSSNGETASPASDALAGYSAWKPLFLARDGVVNPQKRKDFNDTRFEYRWSEWLTSRDGCKVEIRSTGIDENYTIPKITIFYSDRHYRGHDYTAENVAIGSSPAPVTFKPADCERVDLVFWNK